MVQWRRLFGRSDASAPEAEDRILDAQERVAVVAQRAEVVVNSLQGRLRQDRWTDTVSAIARGR